MNFVGTILYTILIKPLETLFEVIFVMANRIIVNPGLAIIALSLSMNFLVLPLYRQADKMQEDERKTEEKLQGWVTHIKKTFRGDERFMMLQAYYRENDYKPYYALRGSLSLLLEIPFFIAAYRFLSTLPLIRGVSFGPIADLGAPDALLKIGAFSVNVLPVLMTLINIVSGAVYTKGAPLKSKVQLYGMALIFLVFLYRSPSGLVFYWTLNNLFSLAKNIFYKLKDPGKVLKILSAAAGLLVASFFALKSSYSTRSRLFFIGAGMLLAFPLLFGFLRDKGWFPERKTEKAPEERSSGKILFVLSALFLSLLAGFLIPSAVIADSTEEFVSVIDPVDPIRHAILSFCLALGFFLVWAGVFASLSSDRSRRIFTEVLWIACILGAVDYMFFGTKLGMITTTLVYEIQPSFGGKEILLNLAVLAVAAAVLHFLYRKLPRIPGIITAAGLCAVLIMSFINASTIVREYKETEETVHASGGVPSIPLSRTGKNVIVIMMDRMCSYYLPFEFHEDPEAFRQFDGFTWYPNCVSFGIHTNYGVPAVYGGFEYTPAEMNKRDTELLADKHNEALKVMPVLFLDHGYDVTVLDPTYAGYKSHPDLSIYDDYPQIHRSVTLGRVEAGGASSESNEKLLNRNFFFYGLMKTAPLFAQPVIYNHGGYNSYMLYESGFEATEQVVDGNSKATGIDPDFMKSYQVLEMLPDFTDTEQEGDLHFIMMSNDLTHSESLLQEPDYLPSSVVDNTEYDIAHHVKYADDGREMDLFPDAGNVYWDGEAYEKMSHYQVNMAALHELGQWFDYLREEGVYDNTRIVIASDHATALFLRDDLVFDMTEGPRERCDMLAFNCMLLVKDFGASGFTEDDRFMTNADVPVLATKGLIDDPVNPFTGKVLDESYKEAPYQTLAYTINWSTKKNNGTVYLPETWFSVKENVFERDNWNYLGLW